MRKICRYSLYVFLCIFLLAGVLYVDFLNFSRRSVPVLAYHRITTNKDIYSMPPEVFEEQMKYLRMKGYNSISLNEYIAKRKEGTAAFDRNIVITFDDGYSDNNRVAMPIMKKYGYTGTVFIAIKYMAWPGYVTWEDVVSLKKNGWEIGSHTYNHVALADCANDSLEKELKDSKAFLNNFDESFNVNTLAYPFGSYNEEAFSALERNGYVAAVTGFDGVNSMETPAYQLYRVNVFNDGRNIGMFAKRLIWAQIMGWARSWGVDPIEIRALLQ